MLIVAFAAWILVGLVVVGAVLLADAGAPPPDVDYLAPHAHASMRVLFVTTHDGHLVIDGLLDLPAASAGVPTTWALELPANPVIARVSLTALERWADDGKPVVLDLSALTRSRPSVVFSRDDVLVRLAALQHSS